MDTLIPDIVEIDPRDARIAPLIALHLGLMRASSPACSVHAMEAGDLADAGARFFAVFDGVQPVAMGALKLLSPDHGELKSMHVAEAARGRGLARGLLMHLLAEARALGLNRVSLETGSQAVFAPARALYRSEGFEECGPFEGYAEDPASVFMSRAI